MHSESETLQSDLFISEETRLSQIEISNQWNQAVQSALEIASFVNPYEADVPEGTEVSAVDARRWSELGRQDDLRPRLVDQSTGEARLIDSGAMVSAARKLPGDKKSDTVKLIAVNGSKIETYGIRTLEFKINRKSYSIPAVICDIKQDILGMDFIHKYKIGFEWDTFDQSQLFITDKKANIKSPLQIVTVAKGLTRAHHVETVGQSASAGASPGAPPPPSGSLPLEALSKSNETIAFEVACVKQLGVKKEGVKKKSLEEQLEMHDKEYVDLIRKYPELLNPTFSKEEPVHGVYHRIDTEPGATPCRAKRRPIVSDPVMAAAGKEAWEQMERDGVIERVKAGSNTEWTSALHLVPKEGGGARPCSDFRELNRKTVPSSYPLPLLRDFSKKIHGSTIFSRIDLKSAFFNIPLLPEHKYKTTTLSPWGGAFVYNRLAFGLCSGPSSWQQLLDTILQDVPNTFCYLDDVLVWAKSKKEHDKIVEQVFQVLNTNKMALSVDKCIFGKPEI